MGFSRISRIIAWGVFAASSILGTTLVSLPLSLGAAGPPDSDGPDDGRQVTIFAIRATPDAAAIDPRLSGIRNQLRKVLPRHGFQLISVRSERIATDQSLTCDLGKGAKVSITLVRALDENARVQLRYVMDREGAPRHSTLVRTPPNQLFLTEQPLGDGSRVLIGIGAR